MKTNMGSADKLIRLLLAIVLILLFYFEVLTDSLGIIALIGALVLTITSLINFCPLYSIFRLSTLNNKDKQYFLSCPKCGELTQKGSYFTWQIIVAILLFPIGLLALLADKKVTVCKKCGHTWQV